MKTGFIVLAIHKNLAIVWLHLHAYKPANAQLLVSWSKRFESDGDLVFLAVGAVMDMSIILVRWHSMGCYLPAVSPLF